MDLLKGLASIGAGIAMLTGLGAAVGQGIATGRGLDAIGRNPDAVKLIRNNLILGIALIETSSIYGLVIAFLIMFVYAK